MMPAANIFATRFGAPPQMPMLPARPIVVGTQPPTLSMPGQMGAPKFPMMPPRPQFGGIQMPQPQQQPQVMPAAASQNAIAARLGMAF